MTTEPGKVRELKNKLTIQTHTHIFIYTLIDVAKWTDMTGLKTTCLWRQGQLSWFKKKKKALGQEMDRKVGGKQHELWIVSPDKVNK